MSYTTALYLRLSVDDDNSNESDSIANQRDLLHSFVAADPVLSAGEILTFTNDGWSGTNFERPAVKELLDLVRRGGVQCVIVKDLSRWGRNYVEVIEYIEQIFPFLGVRFISVNERYDSADYKGQTAPLDVSFNSIAHDIYCRELSYKVRQSYISKAKKGDFLCGVAPFGFVKSTTEKNKLVIDAPAAAIVRRIFTLACEGLTTSEIAATLNRERVDTPLMYRKHNGRTLRGAHSAAGEFVFWNDAKVRKILIDERYTGVQVSGKTRKPKPGSRNTKILPESEWIKVSGAHEAIVTREVFDRANAGIARYKLTGATPSSHVLFAAKIRCGYCGRALRHQHGKNSYHYCNGARLNAGTGCFDGKVYVENIKSIVLAAVKAEAGKVLDERQKRRQATQLKPSKETTFTELKRIAAQINVLERRSVMLYEDFADGQLDKAAYITVKATLMEELSSVQIRSEELTARLQHQSEIKPITDDEPLLRQVLNSTDVTEQILALVDRVTVYDEARIEVMFAFGDTNIVGA